MRYTLRPYQQEAIDAVRAARERAVRRQLLVLPTGLGKTVILAQLPTALAVEGATLVLAHRNDLIQQACDKLRENNSHLWIEVEKAERRASPLAKIVVGSIQSLVGNRRKDFLQRFAARHIELLIIDEAHHATSPTYRAIIEDILALDERTMVLGVTATPNRADRIGLKTVFDEIVYERNISWAISEGYLVPVKSYAVRTKTDISSVKCRGGEFIDSELADACDTNERNATIVNAYRKHTPNGLAVAFTVNRAHATRLAQAFSDSGIPAQMVDGYTSANIRQSVYRKFRNGEIRVLTCADVLREGWDETACDVVIHAAPTRSQPSYIQKTGRGERPIAAIAHQLATAATSDERRALIANSCKPSLTVLDILDESRHSLMSIAQLHGLPPKMNLNGRTVERVAKRYRKLQETAPWLADRVTTVEQIDTWLEEIDAFTLAPPPDDFPWEMKKNRYVLSLTKKLVATDRQGRTVENPYGRIKALSDMHKQRGEAFSFQQIIQRLGWSTARWQHERLAIYAKNGAWHAQLERGNISNHLGSNDRLGSLFEDVGLWIALHRPAAAKKRSGGVPYAKAQG